MRRIYTDTAHFRAPFDSPNISLSAVPAGADATMASTLSGPLVVAALAAGLGWIQEPTDGRKPDRPGTAVGFALIAFVPAVLASMISIARYRRQGGG